MPTPEIPRVLVVDDSPELRGLMLLMLGREGIAAEAAEDGEAALERARIAAPDVLVTDLGLPGIDGLETGRRLRAMCGTRCLLVSGAIVTPEMRTGADAVLGKPFSAADLVAAVRALAVRAPHAQEAAGA